jgi:glucosamine--fructose-6-phosphate aminotransferase (isomerizing)
LDSVVELIKDKKSIYFLGRGLDYLVALEGALKLKEVTYIHVEAIPAGELKHGSIALIDENFVSIVLATQNDTKEKIKTSIAEIKCRGGKVVVISPFKDVGNLGDIWIRVVECEDSLAPFVLSYPLQRLAYLTAISKGINPDKPRNLAKSVTVE